MPQPAITRARILAAISEAGEPLTAPELAEATGLDRHNVNGAVRRAYDSGYLRIAGWHRNFGTSGRLSPRWAAADGRPDEPPPVLDRHAEQLAAKRRYEARTRGVRALKDRARKGLAITPMTMMMYTPGAARRGGRAG